MNKQQNSGFAIVPKEVLCDRELHPIAKVIYSYIASYADKDGKAFPSRDKICYDLNISIGTFTKYLNQLTKAGYISVKQALLDPPELDMSAEGKARYRESRDWLGLLNAMAAEDWSDYEHTKTD